MDHKRSYRDDADVLPVVANIHSRSTFGEAGSAVKSWTDLLSGNLLSVESTFGDGVVSDVIAIGLTVFHPILRMIRMATG